MRITRIIRRIGKVDFQYLVLELILIICGILVAFWIDTRWAEYQDRKQAENYLNALHLELSAVQKNYQERIDVLNEGITYTVTLLEHINQGPESISEDSLHALLWNIRPSDRFFPERAAIDDIVNSGGLSLLESDILRRSISSYIKAIEEDVDLQQEVLTEIRLITRLNQDPYIDLSRVLPAEGIPGISKKELIRIPGMDYRTATDRLFTREFSNYLINKTILNSKLMRSHQRALQENELTIFLIESELDHTNTQKKMGEIEE